MMARGNAVGKRILLVEDQVEVRRATGMLLGLDDHTITEAGDGAEALELYSCSRFDLVITDCAMPRMNGDQLAASIRKQAPSQPILMITGSPEVLNITRQNVDAILFKPFSLAELREAVSKLVSPEQAVEAVCSG
jgi:CheY-like chemotaxis protein